jgi:amino acid transporter
LPEWFTRLHAKYKTPVNSIFFVGATTLAISGVVLLGVGDQEAFELLQIWGFTFYGLAYLALFAIPLLARKERGIRPRLWLRLTSSSGFLMTLLFVVLSAFPIIEVRSRWLYSMKTVCVVAGANALGVLVYRIGKRRNQNVLTPEFAPK